jgi:hypothetical protein
VQHLQEAGSEDAPQQPWLDYSKARLQRGFSHAVGRSVVDSALRAAGAQVGSLSFGPFWRDPGATWEMVFDVYWIGDGRAPYFHSGREQPPQERLLMRWNAVSAAARSRLAPQIAEVWLPQACTWAAAAPLRGNVWAATDHRWRLVHEAGVLRSVES